MKEIEHGIDIGKASIKCDFDKYEYRFEVTERKIEKAKDEADKAKCNTGNSDFDNQLGAKFLHIFNSLFCNTIINQIQGRTPIWRLKLPIRWKLSKILY